jgi:hypothetical protein
MANIYKILQLYAKDIYANTEYDGKGNKKKSKYKIDIIKDGKLSSLFRGSMNANLDINAMCNKFGKDIIKEYQNQLYLTDFISVCFKGKSLEYSPRVDYEDKKKIYVKRGYAPITSSHSGFLPRRWFSITSSSIFFHFLYGQSSSQNVLASLFFGQIRFHLLSHCGKYPPFFPRFAYTSSLPWNI